MRLRLERCGIRSINNLVDVTNYVMLEYGHPLHVFDRARLAGEGCWFGKGRPGEKLECLDGVTRDVNGVLVIADDKGGPVAAAGVMGGQPSASSRGPRGSIGKRPVSSGARASFARPLECLTESSYRFERGTDFEMADRASRRAASLILSLAGGTVDRGRRPSWRWPETRRDRCPA
jgi:phenylalanyl-tRNA synthetase beta chain